MDWSLYLTLHRKGLPVAGSISDNLSQSVAEAMNAARVHGLAQLCAYNPASELATQEEVRMAQTEIELMSLAPGEFTVKVTFSVDNKFARIDVIHAKSADDTAAPLSLADIVDAAERTAITQALVRCDWDKEKVCQELGIRPTTLWRRMERLSITKPVKKT